MKEIKPFNRYEVTANDLERIQRAPQEEIKNRIKDLIVFPGILIPANASSAQIEQGLPTLFTITKSSAVTIDVAPSLSTPSIDIAYDTNGERIEVPYGDAVTGWKGDINDAANDAPRFTTDNVSGFSGLTPFSTGRLNVPDPGGASGTHFVFISYVSICETVAMPSNHESMNGDITGADDYRKPFTMVDQKLGIAYAYRRTNGYRVFVATEAQISVDSNLVPHLNGVSFPSPEDADMALYIGKYTWNGVSIEDSSTVSGHDATHRRPILSIRPMEGALLSNLNKPTTYADGEYKTLTEHINARGGDSPRSNNPHDTRLIDLSDYSPTTAEPQNVQWQGETLGDGIMDSSLTLTLPISEVVSLQGTINNSTIQRTSDMAQFSAWLRITTGADSLGILPTPIYIDGARCGTITPLLSGTNIVTTPYDTYVPFANPTDQSGTYVIYARPVSGFMAQIEKTRIGDDVGDVIGTGEAPTGTFPLCEVFWDIGAGASGELRKTRTLDSGAVFPNGDAAMETIVRPDDKRVFGAVSMPQISTDVQNDLLKNFPATPNLVTNPEFEQVNTDLNMYGLSFADWIAFREWRICDSASNHGSSAVGNLTGFTLTSMPAEWTQAASTRRIDGNNIVCGQSGGEKAYFTTSAGNGSPNTRNGYTDMMTTGPHTNKGLRLAGFVPNSDQIHLVLQNYCMNAIRPNTTYNVSAWVKFETAKATIDICTRLRKCTGTTTWETIGGTGGTKYAIMPHDHNSVGWQLIRTTITTPDFTPIASTASPATNYYALDIALTYQGLKTFVNSAMVITQVNVTEGPTYIPFIRGIRTWNNNSVWGGPVYNAEVYVAHAFVDSYGEPLTIGITGYCHHATYGSNGSSMNINLRYSQTVSRAPSDLPSVLLIAAGMTGGTSATCTRQVILPPGRWEFMLTGSGNQNYVDWQLHVGSANVAPTIWIKIG